MKILVIAGRVPAAEKKGDQVASFHRVMHLARTNQIEIICFGNKKNLDDQEAKQTLEQAGIVVHFVPWKPWVALAQLLRAMPDSRMPFQNAFFRSADFRKTVMRICTRWKPDALYCVMIRVLANADGYKGRLFVDMIDSMGLNFARRASTSTGLMRQLLSVEQRRVSVFEKNVALRADRSFVVSRIDQNAIGTDKVDVIPLGIDMQRFHKTERARSGALVAFTGNMNYQANADAVEWFVTNCWAAVKSAVPGVRLMIVGSNPQRGVVALGVKDKSIVVTGRVPSVADILQTATVAIAPMQIGSGMQSKILEAMACGVPVVTNTMGLGDIGAKPGYELLLADTPTNFSQAVVSLIESEALAKSISDQAMSYVRNNHSWDVLNERFAVACGICPIRPASS